MADQARRGRRTRVLGVLVALAGCASDGAPASEPAPDTGGVTTPAAAPVATTATAPASTTATGEPSPTAVDGVRPDGFTTVTVRITDADGDVCEVCMWLADDGDERGRGLMGVTDLGEPAGMAFVFPQPVEGAFYMLGTPTPLSIAWFAPDGVFVSATDMEPCTTTIAADCERFRAGGTYQLAIEVFAGGLDALGIGPGADAEVVDGSESPTCLVGRSG